MLQSKFSSASAHLQSVGVSAVASSIRVEDPIQAALSKLGTVVSFERNAEVFADEEPAEYVYQVIRGTARTSKLLEDGRRQVSAFHYPGDIFGLAPLETHGFSAEAVTSCKVLVVKRSALEAAAAHDAALASALWMTTAHDLQRVNEHMVLLGRKCATERLLDFLHSTADRMQTPSLVDIPMSRQDIADHLGLTIETVSRTMTRLQEAGVIALEGSRRVRVAERRCAA
ncbi:helix-turn-helix domain-containing protein [Thalassobaculum sp.]|uniref:helix-turn-helix domain-containing protein n=1 Tax=Thalassobaculum sp. TaxID=2022740 RepID=UPI0032EE6639